MINVVNGDTGITLTTGSAGTIKVHVSWEEVDISSTTAPTLNPSRTDTATIATATTTTILGAPAANKIRNGRFIAISNTDATVANLCTVIHNDGTNSPTLIRATLYPNDSLHYNEGGGWIYLPAPTSIQISGRLLLETFKTTGTTLTTTALTNTLRFEMVGGGGGGAGCTSVAAAAGVGGGGGAGGYGETTATVSPSTAYTYAIGTAGAANSGASGGNGGDTTLAIGATTYTAKGATGAVTVASNAALTSAAGGAGGVVGTNNTVNASGAPGSPGIVLLVATPILASGNGGSGKFGGGGVGITVAGAGTSATGNGSGGGGAATGASAVRTGGVGTVGAIMFNEYS